MKVIPVAMTENTLDMLLHLVDKVSHTRDPFYSKEEIEELYSQLAQLKEDLYKDKLDSWTEKNEEEEVDFSDLELAYDKLADLIDFLEEEGIDDTVVEECKDRAAEIQDLIMEFVRKNFPESIEE